MGCFTKETIQNLSELNGESDIVLKNRIDSFKLFSELPNEKIAVFKKYSEKEDYNLLNLKMDQGEIEFEMPKAAERAGVKILPISDILNPDFTEVRNKLFENDDKFSAFTNAFFNCGYFLHVPANIRITNPIVLRTNVENPVISKGVVFVGENSKLLIIEEIFSKGTTSSLQSLRLDIFSEENSEIDYVSLQNLNQKTISFINKVCHMKENSKINIFSGIFGGEKIRTRTNGSLQNSHSELKNSEIIFGSGSQRFDISSNFDTNSEFSNIESNTFGIFSEKSGGYIKGTISAKKGSKNADVSLVQREMLIGNDSKVDTVPCLEIEEENVKRASHSSAVDQIDENQLFYFMSKGIEEDSARKIILKGFFESVLKNVNVSLKQKFLEVIEQKFSDEDV